MPLSIHEKSLRLWTGAVTKCWVLRCRVQYLSWCHHHYSTYDNRMACAQVGASKYRKKNPCFSDHWSARQATGESHVCRGCSLKFMAVWKEEASNDERESRGVSASIFLRPPAPVIHKASVRRHSTDPSVCSARIHGSAYGAGIYVDTCRSPPAPPQTQFYE